MKKVWILLCVILFGIVLLFGVNIYHISSVKNLIYDIYKTNGNYHSANILNSVVKQLNPKKGLDNYSDVVRDDFQITDLKTTFTHDTMDYTYEYKVYGKDKGQEKVIYKDSRNISLCIELQGLNWVIVSAKEIF